MTDRTDELSRRGLLQAAAGGAAVTAGAGAAAAQSSGNETVGNQTSGNQTAGNQTAGNQTAGNETSGGGGGSEPSGPPDFGGFLDDANLYEGPSSVVDATGQSQVTVEVGAGSSGFAFDPPAVHVDNGATVVWEWVGGSHNVVAEDGTFDSGGITSGATYEYTFQSDGIYNYVCEPHESSGMLGSIVVGTDYPTQSTGGGAGGGGPSLPGSAKTIGVATAFVMSTTLGLAYFFMKYGGDYETPG